jgi:hypothetical protein
MPVDNSVDNLWITLNKTPQEPVKGTQGELEVIID